MISVITVCHNSHALMRSYVDSFLACHSAPEDRARIEFLLIENSGDARIEDHARRLRDSGFAAKVKMTENRGFGAGCNEGAALARGRLLALVNPDLEFETSLMPLETAFDGPSWGTVAQRNGPRGINALDLLPEYRSIGTELLRIYRWLHRWKPLYRFAYPVGSFFLITREAFLEAGGFDERFFLYYEEAELSRRLHTRLGPPRFCSAVEVLHEGGGTQPSSDFTLREEARSMVLYGKIIGRPGLGERRLRMLRRLALVYPALSPRVRYLQQALAAAEEA